MAERRMFAKKITESDAFLDMPASSQALYFHLSMAADDEGFVNNPKRVQLLCGASVDDLKLLLAKSFILAFESGIIVIKHWRIHNYIRGDRLKPTDYVEEKSQLFIKDDKSYTLDPEKASAKCLTSDGQMTDNCQQNVGIGKGSVGEVSIGQVRLGEGSELSDNADNSSLAAAPTKKSLIEKYGEANVERYETKFARWAQKKGKQGLPVYQTIAEWMIQDGIKKPDNYTSSLDIEKIDKQLLDFYK